MSSAGLVDRALWVLLSRVVKEGEKLWEQADEAMRRCGREPTLLRIIKMYWLQQCTAYSEAMGRGGGVERLETAELDELVKILETRRGTPYSNYLDAISREMHGGTAREHLEQLAEMANEVLQLSMVKLGDELQQHVVEVLGTVMSQLPNM